MATRGVVGHQAVIQPERSDLLFESFLGLEDLLVAELRFAVAPQQREAIGFVVDLYIAQIYDLAYATLSAEPSMMI